MGGTEQEDCSSELRQFRCHFKINDCLPAFFVPHYSAVVLVEQTETSTACDRNKYTTVCRKTAAAGLAWHANKHSKDNSNSCCPVAIYSAQKRGLKQGTLHDNSYSVLVSSVITGTFHCSFKMSFGIYL